MPTLRGKGKLKCHYCGQASKQSKNPDLRQWDCENCEATNWLDEVRKVIHLQKHLLTLGRTVRSQIHQSRPSPHLELLAMVPKSPSRMLSTTRSRRPHPTRSSARHVRRTSTCTLNLWRHSTHQLPRIPTWRNMRRQRKNIEKVWRRDTRSSVRTVSLE